MKINPLNLKKDVTSVNPEEDISLTLYTNSPENKKFSRPENRKPVGNKKIKSDTDLSGKKRSLQQGSKKRGPYNKTKVSIESSIIDYPHMGLPEDLWTFKEGNYFLKEDIKKDILSRVTEFCKKHNLWGLVKNLYLASSVTSSYYTPSSDVDVKVIMDMEKYKSYVNLSKKSDDEVAERLKHLAREDDLIVGSYVKGTLRELDVFFKTEDTFSETYSDGVYDLFTDKWIKEPYIENIDKLSASDLSVEKRFDKAYNMALKWANSWDLSLGELKRDIKEFEYIIDYLKTLPKKYLSKFQNMLYEKKDEIEENLQELLKDGDIVWEDRHKIYKVDQKLPDYINSINWLPENVQYKLLQRWGYIGLLSELYVLVEETPGLDMNEVPKVKETLKEFF